jgi:hypothetical protein
MSGYYYYGLPGTSSKPALFYYSGYYYLGVRADTADQDLLVYRSSNDGLTWSSFADLGPTMVGRVWIWS